MRPDYLDLLEITPTGWFRDVFVDGVHIGQVKRPSLHFPHWVIENEGRAYESALLAAEALAVTHFDGAFACSTFDNERMKEATK